MVNCMRIEVASQVCHGGAFPGCDGCFMVNSSSVWYRSAMVGPSLVVMDVSW